MREHRQFYINGQWVDPAEPNDCQVIDPSTEEPCAVISLGSAADTDKAVAAAKAALPAWADTPPEARIALIEKMGAIYERRIDEMAEVISMEMGAPKACSASSRLSTAMLTPAQKPRGAARMIFMFVFSPLGASYCDPQNGCNT